MRSTAIALLLLPLPTLLACVAETPDEDAASSEADLIADTACSPHPWASADSCGAFRSSFEGPRTKPRLVYETNAFGPVLASKDGSITFRRESKRYSGHPGWVANHVVYTETRLGATDSTPTDFANRGVDCQLTPNGTFYTCTSPLEVLDAAGNIASLTTALGPNNTNVWALQILSASNRQQLSKTLLTAKADRTYSTSLHPLKNGSFAVGTGSGSMLSVVTPSTNTVVTCELCDFRGVYKDDLLVARASANNAIWKETLWWRPSTNTFTNVPLPPTVYPADTWQAVGVLADGSSVLFRDPRTIDTVSDELAVVGHNGVLRAKFNVNTVSPTVTPLSSGDFLYNSDARVTPQGTALWSVSASLQPLDNRPAYRSSVDGKDITYTVRDIYEGGRRVARRLTATNAAGATVWTYEGPGLGSGSCSVGIAAGRRLFVECTGTRHIGIFAE